MNIVITGMGGPLGESVLKAAKRSSVVDTIVGTDMHPMAAGFYKVDVARVIPGVRRDPLGYIKALKEICSEEKIGAILPCSDPELELISRYRDSFRTELDVVVVSSNEQVVSVASDKFLTCEFLQNNGLRHPRYALLSNQAGVKQLVAEVGFPLIVKPRKGAGSKGVVRVSDQHHLDLYVQLYEDAVVQECLLPDDQEYTLGVFTCADGKPLDPIILHRDLAAGLTYRATVVHNEALREEALRVVSALVPYGPCNLQMRLTQGGPVTFEINPRFSSTTSVRAYFGYNEVDMALRNLVLNEPLSAPSIKSGYMMRYWDELYLDELKDIPKRPRS